MSFSNQPLATLLALALSPAAYAASPVAQGEAIVVTASRVPDKLVELPSHISIITADDIAASPARTVQDLLSTLAGVHVFDSTGSAEGSSVDLRGFGMTGISNTLILVDGFKQNTNDLAAPNLGVVPLGEIERIEVVRGSGAVAYGGGATGGVINIITRSGFRAGQHLQATLTAGSNNLKKLDLSAHASQNNIALDGYVSSLHSDSYRANNAERNDRAGLSATWRHADGDLRFYARSSNQDLGLPGARSVNPATGTDQFADDPRGTATPQDNMDAKTTVVGLQLRQSVGEGMVLLELAQRDKQLTSAFVSSDYTERRDLGELSSSLRYEQQLGRHRLTAGVDALDSHMTVKSASSWGDSASRIEQAHLGAFADVLLRPREGTSFNAGVREQRIEDSARGSNTYQSDSTLHAWQLGARQRISHGWDVYAKVGRSFRVANADEWGFITTALQPQTSRDQELGLAWQQGASQMQAAWFRYDLTNEIHYNPLVPGNVNLDPTRHQGLELAFKHPLVANLTLDSSLTWQQATFRSGSAGGVALAGKDIPMVPARMASIGTGWQPQEATRVGLVLQYVGAQRMDNDQANRFGQRLGAYSVVNAKISHRYSKQLSVGLDVNNLFNRRYATYASSSTSSRSYSIYPAATRNIRVALTVTY